ncbi:unnamed protein product [Amoebophrya sp. A120]|nr:unnamed protein product [Amoebophrya sp. A120]|eukprot:GSA120T00011907001.1
MGFFGSLNFASPLFLLEMVGLLLIAALCFLYVWLKERKLGRRTTPDPGSSYFGAGNKTENVLHSKQNSNVAKLRQAESEKHCVYYQVATKRDYFGTVLFSLVLVLLYFVMVVFPIFYAFGLGVFTNQPGPFAMTVWEPFLPDGTDINTPGYKFFLWYANVFAGVDYCPDPIVALNVKDAATGVISNPFSWALTHGVCLEGNMTGKTDGAIPAFFFVMFFIQWVGVGIAFFLFSPLYTKFKYGLCFQRMTTALSTEGGSTSEQDENEQSSPFATCPFIAVYRVDGATVAAKKEQNKKLRDKTMTFEGTESEKNDHDMTLSSSTENIIVPEIDGQLVVIEKVKDHAFRDLSEKTVEKLEKVPNLKDLLEPEGKFYHPTCKLALRSIIVLSTQYWYCQNSDSFDEPQTETFERLRKEKKLNADLISQIAATETKEDACSSTILREYFGENKMYIEFPGFWKFFFRMFFAKQVVIMLTMLGVFFVSGQGNYPIVMIVILVWQFALAAWQEAKYSKELEKLVHSNRNSQYFERATVVGKDNQLVPYEGLAEELCGTYQVLSSKLILGDIVILDNSFRNQTLPADFVLLTGSAATDESSLTGENVPVQKFAINSDELDSAISTNAKKRHVLYSGSILLETTAAVEEDSTGNLHLNRVFAMVVGTGTETRKGGLLQTMFQQPKYVSVFDKNANKMLLLQVIGAAFVVVIFVKDIFTPFELLLMLVTFLRMGSPLGASGTAQAAKTAAGRLRAGLYKIRTIEPMRFIDASQIQVMCFDKTGTLTEEAQRFDCLETVDGREIELKKEQGTTTSTPVVHLEQPLEEKDFSKDLLTLSLITCNTAAKVNNKIVGNAVECEMLRVADEVFSADFSPNNSTGLEYFVKDKTAYGADSHKLFATVVKQFEFDQQLQLQSVVVKLNNGDYYVLTKGSPRKVIARTSEATSPAGEEKKHQFEQRAQDLARQGRYLLAVAGRKVDPALVAKILLDKKQETTGGQPEEGADDVLETPGSNVLLPRASSSISKLGRTNTTVSNNEKQVVSAATNARHLLEKDLNLLGMIRFCNDLKSDSADCLKQFKHAAILTQIVTGDNIWSGSSIALQSGVVPFEEQENSSLCLLAVDLDKKKKDNTNTSLIVHNLSDKTLPWFQLTGEEILQQYLAAIDPVETNDPLGTEKNWLGLRKKKPSNGKAVTLVDKNKNSKIVGEKVSVRFVLTQDAFHFLRAGNTTSSTGDEEKKTMLKKIFPRTVVFGSMTPDGKTDIIQYWKNEFHYQTGMCGDGGNDSAALRISDMGVSLSNAEDIETQMLNDAEPEMNHQNVETTSTSQSSQNNKSEITFLAPFAADTTSIRACINVLKEARTVAENGLAIYQWVFVYAFIISFVRNYLLLQRYSYFSEFFGTSLDLVSVPLAVYVLARARAPEDQVRKNSSAGSSSVATTPREVEYAKIKSLQSAKSEAKLQSYRAEDHVVVDQHENNDIRADVAAGGGSGHNSDRQPLLAPADRYDSRNDEYSSSIKPDNDLEDPEYEKEQKHAQSKKTQKAANQTELFPDSPNLSPFAGVRVWVIGIILPLALLWFVGFMVLFMQLIAPSYDLASDTWFRQPVDWYGTYLLAQVKHNEPGQSVVGGAAFATAYFLTALAILYLGSGTKFRSHKIWKLASLWVSFGVFFLPIMVLPMVLSNNWLSCTMRMNCDNRTSWNVGGGSAKSGNSLLDGFMQFTSFRVMGWFDFDVTSAAVWMYEPGWTEIHEVNKTPASSLLPGAFPLDPEGDTSQRLNTITRNYQTGADYLESTSGGDVKDMLKQYGMVENTPVPEHYYNWHLAKQPDVFTPGEKVYDPEQSLLFWKPVLDALKTSDLDFFAPAGKLAISAANDRQQTLLRGTYLLSPAMLTQMFQYGIMGNNSPSSQEDFPTGAAAKQWLQDALDKLQEKAKASPSVEKVSVLFATQLLSHEAYWKMIDYVKTLPPGTVVPGPTTSSPPAVTIPSNPTDMNDFMAKVYELDHFPLPLNLPDAPPALIAAQLDTPPRDMSDPRNLMAQSISKLAIKGQLDDAPSLWVVQQLLEKNMYSGILGNCKSQLLELPTDKNNSRFTYGIKTVCDDVVQKPKQPAEVTQNWDFACQQLCQNTWRLNGSLSDSPFHCYWNATEFNSTPVPAPATRKHTCYLFHRTDRARGDSSLLPDAAPEAGRNAIGPDYDLFVQTVGREKGKPDQGKNSVLLKLVPDHFAVTPELYAPRLRLFYLNRHTVLGWDAVTTETQNYIHIFYPGQRSGNVVFLGFFGLMFLLGAVLLLIRVLSNVIEFHQLRRRPV